MDRTPKKRVLSCSHAILGPFQTSELSAHPLRRVRNPFRNQSLGESPPGRCVRAASHSCSANDCPSPGQMAFSPSPPLPFPGSPPRPCSTMGLSEGLGLEALHVGIRYLPAFSHSTAKCQLIGTSRGGGWGWGLSICPQK